jgi:hypothetical protein
MIELDYENFKAEWQSEIIAGNSSATELGQNFSRKILGD